MSEIEEPGKTPKSVRFAQWLIERNDRETEPISKDGMICRFTLVATVFTILSIEASRL